MPYRSNRELPGSVKGHYYFAYDSHLDQAVVSRYVRGLIPAKVVRLPDGRTGPEAMERVGPEGATSVAQRAMVSASCTPPSGEKRMKPAAYALPRNAAADSAAMVHAKNVSVFAGRTTSSMVAASNDTVLADEDGVFSDWIEISNPTGAPISLAGYHLSDSSDNLTRWRFPDVMLGAMAFTVGVWFWWTGPVRRRRFVTGAVGDEPPPHATPEPPI